MDAVNTVPASLWEWLAAIDPDKRFVLSIMALVFAFIVVVAAVGAVANVVRSIHQSRVESALKRELLDQGLPADEIARIVEAKSGGPAAGCGTRREA